MTDAVRTSGLTKRFRSGQLAVDDLDLQVPAGSVFGFLGPNGSGKTTTIRMLLGLAAPTAGSVTLLGETMPHAARTVLPQVGALIEGPACYPFLSGRDNLVRFDRVDATADPRTRCDRVAYALERVGLTAAAGKRYRAYSLGMRQRLCLAVALLRPRALLVLDEPTNGLDPQGTREIRQLVRDLAADGTTVFLSSHLLAEIEQVCTHAAVMAHGRLVAQDTVDALRAAARGRLVVRTPDTALAAETLVRLGVPDVRTDGDRVHGEAVPAGQASGPGGAGAGEEPGVSPDVACAALVHAGVRVFALDVERPSLEEAFVALTGEGFDVAE